MITIYTRAGCRYCDLSKSLLDLHRVPYNELSLDTDITVEQLKSLVPGARSVPQIMDDGLHIGGYKELARYLEQNGQ
jgi:glutaredoxin